jgi:SAM-dependent methyltransferase
MALKHVQKTYEAYGKDDPMYAVLSREHGKGNKWDPEAFFATGVEEITEAMQYLDSLRLEVRRGRALDFGCGAGRLTQALAGEFEEAVGVDISWSMAESARKFNQQGDRCSFVVNTEDNLACFEDASFDFIYTNKTLQHNPPEASTRYIAEFFRILRPGGIAYFQIPSGKRHDPGTFGAWLYGLRRGTLKRWWKSLRGKPPVELHYVNQGIIEEIIRDSGGRLVAAHQKGSVHSWRVSIFYAAVRQS